MEPTKQQRQHSIDDNNKEKKLKVDSISSSKSSISQFEDLSNKIIYEIFEFLDYYYIYKIFFNLNIRFQNLLMDSSFSINMNLSSISKVTFQYCYTQIIIPYQRRIKSLHLSNPFIIDRVFSLNNTPLDFIRLEKLSLTDSNPIFFDELLTRLVSFPYLFSLIINCVNAGQNESNTYRQIFRLPALKYCKLSCKFNLVHEPLPIATTEFSPIECLVIKYPWQFIEINTLLSYIPQLRRLSLHCENRLPSTQTVSCLTVLNHLTHVFLNIEHVHVTFNEVESMIKNLFQQVEVLNISIGDGSTFFDADRWQQIILSHMSYLRIFHIIVYAEVSSDEDINEYIALINQFNSPFWIERQWFFEHRIDTDLYWHRIVLQSTNPYKRKQYKIDIESDKYIDSNEKQNNIDSVVHVRIQNEEAISSCNAYFPNAIALTILRGFVDQIEYPFSTNLNRIIPLKQLTKLKVADIYDSFSEIIELLYYTPNIHTLKIIFVACCKTDLILLQQSETFELVSKTNNIKKLTIVSNNILKVIKFLVTLCPQLQHLTINTSEDGLKPVLQFLLSKDNSNTRYLRSLRIERLSENEMETLKTFFESEILMNICFVKVNENIRNNMYLWW